MSDERSPAKKVAVLRGIVGTSHEIDALTKPPAVEQHSLAEAEKVSALHGARCAIVGELFDRGLSTPISCIVA
jgi:hypothetical protein